MKCGTRGGWWLKSRFFQKLEKTIYIIWFFVKTAFGSSATPSPTFQNPSPTFQKLSPTFQLSKSKTTLSGDFSPKTGKNAIWMPKWPLIELKKNFGRIKKKFFGKKKKKIFFDFFSISLFFFRVCHWAQRVYVLMSD